MLEQSFLSLQPCHHLLAMLQLPNAAHAHAKEAAGNKNMNCSNSSHVKPTKDLKHSNANKKMAARKKFHVADKNRT